MDFQGKTNSGTTNLVVPYNQTRQSGHIDSTTSYKLNLESAIETMVSQGVELGKYCDLLLKKLRNSENNAKTKPKLWGSL